MRVAFQITANVGQSLPSLAISNLHLPCNFKRERVQVQITRIAVGAWSRLLCWLGPMPTTIKVLPRLTNHCKLPKCNATGIMRKKFRWPLALLWWPHSAIHLKSSNGCQAFDIVLRQSRSAAGAPLRPGTYSAYGRLWPHMDQISGGLQVPDCGGGVRAHVVGTQGGAVAS